MLTSVIGWCLCSWLAPKAWKAIKFFLYEYPELRRRSARLVLYVDWYVGLDHDTLSYSELIDIERETDLILKMHRRNWDYHGIIERRLERIGKERSQDPRSAGPATTRHFRG